MKLAIQFGLVSLSLLLVPWAGCAFLAENERALQQAQVEATRAVATTTATALADRVELIYPHAARMSAPIEQQGLMAAALAIAPRIDGWLATNEWQAIRPRRFGSTRRSIGLWVARHREQRLLGIEVVEPTPQYRSPQRQPLLHSDRVELRLGSAPSAQFVAVPEGPGQSRLMRVTGTKLLPVADTQVGWQETATGYQIEIALPESLVAGRLGVQYVGEDDSGSESIATQPEAVQLPWLVSANSAMDRWLTEMQPSGMQLRVYDRWQWPLAASGAHLDVVNADGSWLLRALYRRLVPEQVFDQPPVLAADGRQQTPWLHDGRGHAFYLQTPDGPMLTVSAPVEHEGELVGTVTVARPLQTYLSLTDQAFAQLLGRGLLVLLLTGTALLGFAGLTSWRLQRLSQKLGGAAGAPGAQTRLPISPLGDEIDALALQFNRQLSELEDYQRYLTSLNQTLAHELRTPVAIIASSLENLRIDSSDTERRQELLTRATAGVERLQALFAALQEARRLEQAVDTEARETLDIGELLRELTGAYAQTFSDHQFGWEAPDEAANAVVSPEQLVQAMDKLVENAVSYAPKGSSVLLSLTHRGLWWRLAVTNKGPSLPEGTERSLFEPLISHRKADDQGFHMGLGLHIVRLVAQHHGGEAFAHNLKDGSGVSVGFSIRGFTAD